MVKKSKVKKIDKEKNKKPKTIESKLKRLCTEKFNLENIPKTSEYSKKYTNHYIKVRLFISPLATLPNAGSTSSFHTIMNEISDLETEIPISKEKISDFKKKNKEIKGKIKTTFKEMNSTLSKDKKLLKRKQKLVKQYSLINKRLNKLMIKNGFVKSSQIGKETRWMKAVTPTSVKIVTLQII